MEFGILGPLEVRSGGEPVDLGPPKQRALLALLLLHVDRVVPTERILEALWGDDAVGKENSLWVHISRLRSALEPGRAERGQSTVLITRDHGYSIRADPRSVDAVRFEAALSEARGRLAVDPDGAATALREALGLWRGSALQDFSYDEFAQSEIVRLEELRLEAVETAVEAELRRGLGSELVGELESLVHQHPLRERPVAQLMRALYRAGRQAEALRAFQHYRSRIADELGLEPSAELRRLGEQVLLHDQRLGPSGGSAERVGPATNPFKGLHTFQESDADDFFGRDRLLAEAVTRLGSGCRVITLVGPSGSGKSSVVRAGLIPAIRKGALEGSDRWLVASMVPGAHPFAELEAALLRSAFDPPDSLHVQLADHDLGLLRAALRLLPDDGSRLVLVIDQFEELFTLADDEQRGRFLANLVSAIDDPRGRVLVVATLRADAYDLPLTHSDYATRMGPGVVNVLPLTVDELEEAATAPAARRGVGVDSALLTELLTDVVGQPGVLPIFQYALTELFARRAGDRLTVDGYRAIGGARGVLSRQADDVFQGLSPTEQEAARQLFLRLVTIGEQEHWSRRRVPASEIVATDVDLVAMESVIDRFGRQRFLAFDRDHATGAPTVEVAHEALLWEWDRLRDWIEEGRLDIARRTSLDAAMAEWVQARRDDDYLLTGNRLADYQRWWDATDLRLTTAERDYLATSIALRDAAVEAEAARVARETGLARRARRGWWALAAVAGLIATGAIAVLATQPGDRPNVAMLTVGGGAGDIGDLLSAGLERASRELDVDTTPRRGPFTSLTDELTTLADSGTDLLVVTDFVFADAAVAVAARRPEVTFAYVDAPIDGFASVTFAEHEGAYLTGAAAAATSVTGTVGFVGGLQFAPTERFRAGFEAGARAVDPDIEIAAVYVAPDSDGFVREDLVHDAAVELYRDGVDVVLHAAGSAGDGVFAAAYEQSAELGRHLWAIGADADQYFDVPVRYRPHLLTSAIKRFDVAIYEIVADFLDGGLEPTNRELTLADGGVGFSTSGGHLPDDLVATLDGLAVEIAAGERSVPRSPSGPLRSPPFGTVNHTATVTFDGVTCQYDGPREIVPGVAEIRFVNTSSGDALFGFDGSTIAVWVPAAPNGSNAGHVVLPPGRHEGRCVAHASTGAIAVAGPTLDVRVDHEE